MRFRLWYGVLYVLQAQAFGDGTVSASRSNASRQQDTRFSNTQRKDVMDRSMTTTAFHLDGFNIAETHGVVRGITVRSRSIFGRLGASLQTLVGGNITLFTELCEKTRAEAFDMMVLHAEALGANAVTGIRYDATEIMDGVTEVLCYGNAVVVKRDHS
jgi:uncharacterized protein YbjQ (UPF0145 family)